MLSKVVAAVAALTASVSPVLGQTSTDCNPLKTNCPADPAIGLDSVECDFTQGKCDAFDHLDGRAVSYDGAHGLVCSMDAPHQAPTLRSKKYIFFGRVEMEMQAAPGAGIASTLVLQSDDLDEIDFEAIGNDNSHIQTNIFSKGDQEDHTYGDFQAVHDTTGKSHRYAVEWTPEKLEWFIDGVSERTLLRSDAGDKFPQSPMQVRVGAWVAGFDGADPGTIHWAGGKADFSNGPSTAYYKSIKITDYAGGSSATDKDVKEYSYGDHTGNSGSIQIKLNDGNTITGGEPSHDSGSTSKSTTTSDSSSHSNPSTKNSDEVSKATSGSSSNASNSSTASTASSTVIDSSTTGISSASGTPPSGASPTTDAPTSNDKSSATGSQSSSTPNAAADHGVAIYAAPVAALAAVLAI